MKKSLYIIISQFFVLIALSGQTLYVNPIQAHDSMRFFMGGYGEILYQHMDYGPNRMVGDGASSDSRASGDIPRMILSFDYKFKNGFAFSSEIEFEHGGTGSSIEYEYEESGEWETEVEKGGEVVLEQFFLSKYFSDAFSIKVGHFVVPIGLTNQNHLPTQFFATVRPEGENTIIPLTWHETGIAVVGRYKKWNYEAQLINGLDANGMTSANWIKNAQQTQYENVKMSNMALAFRLDNRSIPYLKLGTSFYRGNTTANTTKPDKMNHVDGTVTIGTFDAVYHHNKLIFRGSAVYGQVDDSEEISDLNNQILSRYSPYTRTPVAKNALCYSFELGYDLAKVINLSAKLFPFVRYEYYNAMEKTESGVFSDPRYKRNVTTVGLNYFPISNLAIKFDYAMRKIDGGKYNDENTFGIAVGYYGIFARL